MSTRHNGTYSGAKLKKNIIHSLENIPPEGLKEVANFLKYVHYRFQKNIPPKNHYNPIALGGLWKGLEVSDDDITSIRNEIWGKLGDKEL